MHPTTVMHLTDTHVHLDRYMTTILLPQSVSFQSMHLYPCSYSTSLCRWLRSSLSTSWNSSRARSQYQMKYSPARIVSILGTFALHCCSTDSTCNRSLSTYQLLSWRVSVKTCTAAPWQYSLSSFQMTCSPPSSMSTLAS